ncbi:MAG: PepSY-associated TM helix domain-containing protein [Pseudomonadota bacterium]
MKRTQQGDRTWFLIHSWIGLKLSVLMSFVLITGTFAVISYEIDWLLNPEMRAATPVSEVASWGKVYESLQTEYPRATIASIGRQEDPWWAVEASVLTPWGELGRLWFDPDSGAFQGATGWVNVQRFFRTTHRHLMLPTQIGIPIVASLAFPLLLSLLAGFLVYKKFWRGFFRWPRFAKPVRIWSGDLHRLLGLWSSWFLLLIALTSVWYLVEVLGGNAPPFPEAAAPMARDSAVPQTLTGSRIDAMVADAQAALPGLSVRRIVFPQRPEGALLIQGDLSAVLVRPRANSVAYDPSTGSRLGAYRGEALGIHQRISEMADPLHFGYFGGLGTKILWFLLGFAMSALSITGCVIYSKRLVKHHGRRGATAAPA